VSNQWEQGRYNTTSRTLGKWFDMAVTWYATRTKGSDDPPYVVWVGGRRLKKRFTDQSTAMQSAEDQARAMLEVALTDLVIEDAAHGPKEEK